MSLQMNFKLDWKRTCAEVERKKKYPNICLDSLWEKVQAKANDYKEVNHGCSISQCFTFESYTILIPFIKIEPKAWGDYTQSGTTAELQTENVYFFLLTIDFSLYLIPVSFLVLGMGAAATPKTLWSCTYVTRESLKRNKNYPTVHVCLATRYFFFFYPSRRMTGDMSKAEYLLTWTHV